MSTENNNIAFFAHLTSFIDDNLAAYPDQVLLMMPGVEKFVEDSYKQTGDQDVQSDREDEIFAIYGAVADAAYTKGDHRTLFEARKWQHLSSPYEDVEAKAFYCNDVDRAKELAYTQGDANAFMHYTKWQNASSGRHDKDKLKYIASLGQVEDMALQSDDYQLYASAVQWSATSLHSSENYTVRLAKIDYARQWAIEKNNQGLVDSITTAEAALVKHYCDQNKDMVFAAENVKPLLGAYQIPEDFDFTMVQNMCNNFIKEKGTYEQREARRQKELVNG